MKESEWASLREKDRVNQSSKVKHEFRESRLRDLVFSKNKSQRKRELGAINSGERKQNIYAHNFIISTVTAEL